MTAAVLAAILAAVIVGSALQRISGMGLALVAAPILSLLLGPIAGILVINLSTVVSSTLIAIAVWRDVQWRMYLLLGPTAVLGSIPGALLVREAPLAWLDVIVGATVLLGLAVSLRLHRAPAMSGPVPAVLAGVGAGFMNTTAGVAGPAMTIYALASRWEQRGFAATLQPIFLTIGVISFGTKVALGATGEGGVAGLLPWWVWPLVVAGLVGGVAAGGRLAPRVGPRRARTLAVSVAVVGAAVALGRGLLSV